MWSKKRDAALSLCCRDGGGSWKFWLVRALNCAREAPSSLRTFMVFRGTYFIAPFGDSLYFLGREEEAATSEAFFYCARRCFSVG